MKQFWLQEEQFEVKRGTVTLDHDDCMKGFLSSDSRDSEGRFMLRYPLKEKIDGFGNSYELALKMLKHQERRYDKNPELYQKYRSFMKKYEELGHMVKVEPAGRHDFRFYLPHHCVIKETGTTTKVRVVFNGLQVNNTGKSLNNYLYEGPKLLNLLVSVLTKWRAYKYAFSCDIKQMFCQILIHPEDRKYQRILWRHTIDSEV